MVKYQSFDAVFVKKSNETVLSLKWFQMLSIVMKRWREEGGVPQTNEWDGFLLEMFSEAVGCIDALER
jgi:hypothetical protein